MTEREIFFEALDIATPVARAAYLQGMCGRDVTLRRKVEELLKEHFSDDSLVAGPAVEGERAAAVESSGQEAPAEMSPASAGDIDTRADIYSLGVLLYELLVGQTPFDAKEMIQGGLDAMRQIIREKEPLPPSTRLTTLPGDELTTTAKRRSVDTSKLLHQLKGDLDWIVMKCLEKDRTRRYETANGLAADIKRHLANEPVVARPPSTAYKIQKASFP